jgi:hypothetical protein
LTLLTVSFAGAGAWVKANQANARNSKHAEIRVRSVRLMSGHYIKLPRRIQILVVGYFDAATQISAFHGMSAMATFSDSSRPTRQGPDRILIISIPSMRA